MWRREIGIWGTTSSISQDLANMKSNYLYFDFFRNNLTLNETAMTCLQISFMRYRKILEFLTTILDQMKVSEFQSDDIFKSILEMKNKIDLNSIFNDLVDHHQKFSELGLKVNYC